MIRHDYCHYDMITTSKTRLKLQNMCVFAPCVFYYSIHSLACRDLIKRF